MQCSNMNKFMPNGKVIPIYEVWKFNIHWLIDLVFCVERYMVRYKLRDGGVFLFLFACLFETIGRYFYLSLQDKVCKSITT